MKKILIILFFIFSMLITINVFGKNDEYSYSEEELDKGIINKEEINIEHNNENYIYNKTYFYNDNYILIGSHYTGIKNTITNEFGYEPYISVNNFDGEIWNATISSYGIGEFIDVVIYDDCIYLLALVKNYHGNIDPLIIKFNFNRQVIAQYYVMHNNLTLASRIFVMDNSIFVVGMSRATDIIPNANYNSGMIYVMQLTTNLILSHIELYGNENATYEIFDCACNNDLIYIYCYSNGSGYYRNGYQIISINSRFDLAVIEDIDNLNYKFFKLCDGTCLINYESYDNVLKLKKYNYETTLTNTINIDKIIFNSNVTDFDLFENEDNIILSASLVRNNKNSIKVFFISKDLNLLSDFEFEGNNIIKNVHLVDDYLYIFTTDINSKNIKLYKISYIEKKGEDLYFNNILFNKQIIWEESKNYGNYDVNIKYEYNNIEININTLHYVPLVCNVNNGEKYDVGYVLHFNGKATLNQINIKDGEKITEPGTYTLKIIGNKGEETYFTFSIENLCLNVEKEIDIRNDVVLKETIKENKIQDINKINYGNIKYETEVITQTNNYLIIILVCVVTFLSGIFIPIFKKHGE